MTAAWLQVTSGEGPAECERAVRLVADELVREAAGAGVTATLLDAVSGEKKDGLQSALFAVEGDALEAFVSGWAGTVLWMCRSPYRPTHRRKNWFVGVAILTAPEERTWTPGEVAVETMRASGPGGQHVNKAESAVRVTHAPTGLVAVAREERSQHRNKALALARLAEMIAGRNAAARRKATAARREMHRELVRGNPIRTYTGPDFERSTD